MFSQDLFQAQLLAALILSQLVSVVGGRREGIENLVVTVDKNFVIGMLDFDRLSKLRNHPLVEEVPSLQQIIARIKISEINMATNHVANR